MTRARVVPVVEGHGEVQAVPILLRRIWEMLAPGGYLDVLRPVRVARDRIIRRKPAGAVAIDAPELFRAMQHGAQKLYAKAEPGVPALVLVLLDSHDDCPALVAPELGRSAGRSNVAFVLAHVEYETWFVAAASSLAAFLRLDDELPLEPESQRCGKRWVTERFRGPRYSETVDQPRLTAAMDLKMCRGRSPSFDKLCREMERLRDG